MTKAALQAFYDELTDSNSQYYLDYNRWNEKVNQYLQEL